MCVWGGGGVAIGKSRVFARHECCWIIDWDVVGDRVSTITARVPVCCCNRRVAYWQQQRRWLASKQPAAIIRLGWLL
jgi:hypothetical protein